MKDLFLKNDFVQAIQDKRHKLGLTQDQAAEQIGIHVRTFKSFEGAERQPGTQAFYLVCKWLGISMDNFFPSYFKPKSSNHHGNSNV